MKMVNTKLVLGLRTIGYEFYEVETGEIVGLSEKDICDILVEGEEKLLGFHLDNEGKNAILDDKVNLVKEAGIASSAPIKPITGMVNEIFTLIGKDDKAKTYEVLNSRWGHKHLPENKLVALAGSFGAAHKNSYTLRPKGRGIEP